MTEWRPITYIDTGSDTSGIKYVDIPNGREYKVYSINVKYAQDTSITYTAALAPVMQIVTSTTSHTSATERILGTFSPVTALISDTTDKNVIWSPAPPGLGDTGQGIAWLTSYYSVEIPEIILSTEHRIKFTTVPATGGALYMDVEGLLGIRRLSG